MAEHVFRPGIRDENGAAITPYRSCFVGDRRSTARISQHERIQSLLDGLITFASTSNLTLRIV